MASRIGVSKQPGARLFEWRDERAKRSRFARAKGVRVRITYAYNDPLSEASVLHPPLSSLPACKTDSNAFFLFLFFLFVFPSSTTNAIHLSTIVRMETLLVAARVTSFHE